MFEFLRVFLADLPLYEAAGWRPAVLSPCGAVGAEPWCAHTLAVVLVFRVVA